MKKLTEYTPGENIPADVLQSARVIELKGFLRALRASGGFAGASGFAEFAAFASKDQLIEAITTGAIPAGANIATPPTQPAEATQESVPVPAQDDEDDPLAFARVAINKAVAKAVAKEAADGAAKLAAAEARHAKEIASARAAASHAPHVAGIPAPVLATPGTGGSALEVVVHGSPLRVPSVDAAFVIEPRQMTILEAAVKRAKQAGAPKGVRLIGHRGCGKSSLPEQFAAVKKLPFFKLNAGIVREPKEWFGAKTALNGSLKFIQAQFASALETPGAVVVVDEINRATPSGLNAMFGILDSGVTYVEELGRELVVAPGVLVCATMNIGGEYSVNELDVALKDRFPFTVLCDYLNAEQETSVIMAKAGVPRALAEKVVGIAASIRAQSSSAGLGMANTLTETLSTRQSIELAWALHEMGSDAIHECLLNRFSDAGGRESERAKVLTVCQGFGMA